MTEIDPRKIEQNADIAERLWKALVNNLGEEEAKTMMHNIMRADRADEAATSKAGGRPRERLRKFLERAIDGLTSHGEEASPEQIAAAMDRSQIRPIEGTDFAMVISQVLSELCEKAWAVTEQRLKERGLSPDGDESLTNETFSDALSELVGADIAAVYVGPDKMPKEVIEQQSPLEATREAVKRQVNRIKKRRGLAKDYAPRGA